MPQKPRRLSRDIVIKEARSLVQHEGIEALSIRRLAAALHVTPMAIYRHVEDKQELMEGILAQIILENDVTFHNEANWKDWLVECCLLMRRSISQHPEIVPILAAMDRMSPLELQTFDTILEKLLSAGLSFKRASSAFHVAISFTFGSIALEQFKLRVLPSAPKTKTQRESSAYPHIDDCIPYLAKPITDNEFRRSLSRIMESFEPSER